MAKSTLQVIKGIEDEAKLIQKSYQDQIGEIEQTYQDSLQEEREALDRETVRIINEQETAYQAAVAEAQADLEATIASYKARTNQALTDNKDTIVQAIVEEVVNLYGN
ncbi:hypothetical protein CL176_06135 [Suicoccus acidiformans]|uniref:Uncharacterized protein n=1 Tax=Suicoccus acidiformans TaxID=2036206 RepID=A0A347WKK0_9LACT|nr:hypothetical protein [Suicoccus acidiformans]AXY25607.1 hypothetical protein CL176_06135 [Suicoccus acidiformans]